MVTLLASTISRLSTDTTMLIGRFLYGDVFDVLAEQNPVRSFVSLALSCLRLVINPDNVYLFASIGQHRVHDAPPEAPPRPRVLRVTARFPAVACAALRRDRAGGRVDLRGRLRGRAGVPPAAPGALSDILPRASDFQEAPPESQQPGDHGVPAPAHPAQPPPGGTATTEHFISRFLSSC